MKAGPQLNSVLVWKFPLIVQFKNMQDSEVLVFHLKHTASNVINSRCFSRPMVLCICFGGALHFQEAQWAFKETSKNVFNRKLCVIYWNGREISSCIRGKPRKSGTGDAVANWGGFIYFNSNFDEKQNHSDYSVNTFNS